MIINNALVRSSLRRSAGQALFLRSTPRFYLSEKDERFFRLIDFDAKYLQQIPWFFEPLRPAIELGKGVIVSANQQLGLPWWLVIVMSSVAVRMFIFPLILVQMKKMSKIGPIWPIFAHFKQAWGKSALPKSEKVKLALRLYDRLCKQEGFRMRSIFVYNLAYYPLLITMIFTLRSVISVEEVSKSGFLYLTNFADIDPYFILPTLTVACYYWNFQRFITPENKHTLISRIRSLCQVLLIVWYPFLCCWPSGIVIYMMCNALMSIGQSSLMKSMWFQSKLNPRIMHYNYMLQTVEFDKGTSESIVEAIKTGDESLKEKAIQEAVLVEQTMKMIQKLNSQLEVKDGAVEEKQISGQITQEQLQNSKALEAKDSKNNNK